MHILGKVMIGLVIVGALAGAYLTMKLSDTRAELMGKVDKRLETYEGNLDGLRVARLNAERKRNEVNRIMEQWGRVFPTPQVNVANPQTGAINFPALGGNQGLARQEVQTNKPLPTVYLFGVNPDGSRYTADFQLTEVQGGAAAAQLTREPYPGEVQQWQAAQWRVRQFIPEAWRSVFIGLQKDIAIAFQDRQTELNRVKIQDEAIAASQFNLDNRLFELEGDPDAPAGASFEVKEGLIASIRKEESERNAVLARIDELRRTFDAKYRQLTELLAGNREKVDQLGSEKTVEAGIQITPRSSRVGTTVAVPNRR